MNIKFDRLKFRAEAQWDNSAFMGTHCTHSYEEFIFSLSFSLVGQSDVPTRFQKIDLVVEVETPERLSQEKFNTFTETVEKTCPVANLIQAAGTELSAKWILKNV